jgi:hypothetical protein
VTTDRSSRMVGCLALARPYPRTQCRPTGVSDPAEKSVLRRRRPTPRPRPSRSRPRRGSTPR